MKQWINKNAFWIPLSITTVLAAILFLPGCGRSQRLQSITLIPGSVDFQGIGAQIQFKAIGNFIHPPETIDITNEVQWTSNAPTVATINSSGLATGTNTCGSGEIIASHSSDPSSSSPSTDSDIVATAAATDGVNGGICP